jgi:hypothetical protein
MKAVFSFQLFGNDLLTIGGRHVKFCMDKDHTHTYKLCMKYGLQVNNYKHGDSANI